MEPDVDLRATICGALLLEGHRVEAVADCAGMMALGRNLDVVPDELLLALGARRTDPDWEALRIAVDEDPMLSQAAVIVLLTIGDGLTFPARARLLQKPFSMEELLAMVAADVKAARSRS